MHLWHRIFAAFVVAISLAFQAPSASAEASIGVQMEEFRVPSVAAGLSLYVRNKHPSKMTRFSPNKTLLFVHGAGYPAESTFDLELDGLSWMDYIAQHGYDVYLVDLRGYGRSSRPPQMDQPPQNNPPLERTKDAVNDVGSAVDFILKRRGISKLDLMGWSWGTAIMGAYTAQFSEKVNKLALYAVRWIEKTPSPVTPGSTLGAYRSITIDSAKQRWLDGVPDDQRRDIIPAGWFEKWAAATLATDPVGSARHPAVFRAPNGVTLDSREYWQAGKPYYDPGQIRVPTLLIHAELDQDLPTYMDDAYFPLLTNAPYKRYVQIGGGTHFIMMERNRMELFHEVQLFLDEEFTPGM
jgi:pimeloyl-ACP methyl ester carboxylesterase